MNDLAFQIALFPKDFSLKNPSALIADISGAVQSSSGIDLVKQNIFPENTLGASNPNIDIPRAIASSEDDSVIFQANDHKINFTLQTVSQDKPVSEKIFWELIERVLQTPTLNEVKFTRLGFIHTHLIDTDNFAPYAKEILSDKWSKGIDSFNMLLGYKEQHEELNLNININITSVHKLGTEDKAIQVQADINTLINEDASLFGPPIEVLKTLSSENLTSRYIDSLKVEKE